MMVSILLLGSYHIPQIAIKYAEIFRIIPNWKIKILTYVFVHDADDFKRCLMYKFNEIYEERNSTEK
jgi:hypothetical protein